ncbi:MAG TPA: YHYH domain-containing protein [Candidatus Humimicrobiaceae bacterium]|nr:YHYH domain-containing protein [Candidatus Humimicrobiaceae bacterium]
MLKSLNFKIFIISVLVIFPITIFAHPGRTDANGCHTCRTNCEKWRLSYGEYHCHNKPIEAMKEVKNTARTEARQSARAKAK